MEKEGKEYPKIMTAEEIYHSDVLEIRKYFCNIVQNDQNVSVGVAAIRTLMEVIKHCRCM